MALIVYNKENSRPQQVVYQGKRTINMDSKGTVYLSKTMSIELGILGGGRVNFAHDEDSNEVKRFIEAMEGISKILDANSLIYRPILDGHRYITEQELSKALKITKRTLIEYRMNGKLPYYKIGGKILYKEQDIIEILERNKVLAFE